jgi:hypothetical protein
MVNVRKKIDVHLRVCLRYIQVNFDKYYTVKKVTDFPVPSRDVTDQTLSDGD